MKTRNLVWLLATFVLTIVSFAEGQQSRVARIGFLSGGGDPANPPNSLEAFRQGLRDIGYFEGKNYALEPRYAAGNRDLIQDLWLSSCNSKWTCSLPEI